MEPKVITPGALLVKSLLPSEAAKKAYDPSQVLDKKGVQNLMSNIIVNGGAKSHESITALSNLFFDTSTTEGFSTPLSDYENDDDERQALLGEFKTKINQIQNSKLNEKEKNDSIGNVSGEFQSKAQKLNLKYMVAKGSTAGQMAMTGARGNPMQLAQGTFSPLLSEDIEGKAIPLPIEHSFAEGLTAGEHLAMAYGGRASTVKTQLSTSKPGALFKELTPTVFHEVVTIHDCQTRNGIPFPVNDRHRILNHVEAENGKVVDDQRYRDLKSSGAKTVRIRTTMTCNAKEGVCQKCYGYDSRGHFPRIGENVGVLASQSVSEVLTQAMLSTKHKGGVAGKKVNTYDAAYNMLHVPEEFKDLATVARLNGKVSKIEKTDLGDSNVFVDAVKHFVPNSQQVQVKEGDEVEAGHAISTGTINPKELMELRGMGEARKYMSSSLRDIYGGGLDPRHFDLIARNLAKYVVVKNPGNTDYLPEDVIESSKLNSHWDSDTEKTSLSRAVGKKLARGILELTPGTVLNENHVNYLNGHGVSQVITSKSGLEVEPMLKGIGGIKLLDKNWLSRLAGQGLSKSIIQAATYGQSSDIHSTDPIAAYVVGKDFGKGGSGRY